MGYCTSCGAVLPDDASFCGSCGRKVYRPSSDARASGDTSASDARDGGALMQDTHVQGVPSQVATVLQQAEAEGVGGSGDGPGGSLGSPGGGYPDGPSGSGQIKLYPDGSYRWVYEFNLLTNPTILLTLAKVFVGILVGIGVFSLAIDLPDYIHGYNDLDDLLASLRMGGIISLIMLALLLVGYAIYALVQGGKYCAMFTMDEHGIEHRQMPKEFKRAQAIGALNVLAGLVSGNPTQVGIGLTSAARDTMTTDFDSVRSIKGSRMLRVIKVNQPLAKNQVYVDPQDYDFVFSYIRDRCPNAKKVRG